MNPTLLDFIVIGVVLLSTALAFIRGLTREMFSLLAWVGGAAAGWFLLPYTEPYARQIVDDVLAARIIGSVAVFVAALFAITLVGSPVVGRVRESRLRSIDRMLGGMFGVARGAVLVVLGYVVLISFYPTGNRIPWMHDAVSRPFLEQGLTIARTLLPEGVIQRSRQAAQDLRGSAEIEKRLDETNRPDSGGTKSDDPR